MSILRDLLENGHFQSITRQIAHEASLLGYKKSSGSFVSPPAKHAKLERGRTTSSKQERRASRTTTTVVPGMGPRKYRMKFGPVDPLPIYSRAQRLTWDDPNKPTELPFTHTCEYSGCKACR